MTTVNWKSGNWPPPAKIQEDMAGPASASEELIAQQKAAREQFTADTWAKLKARGDPKNYYPARALPRDGVLVVRTDALLEFEESLNDAASGSEKPLTANGRNTLLTIVAALCDFSAIKLGERNTVKQIVDLTAEFGAP